MALEMAYTDVHGVEHGKAYVRVLRVYDDYARGERVVDVGIYHDHAARLAGRQPFPATHYFEVMLGDARASTYAHLKTMPAYAPSVDV